MGSGTAARAPFALLHAVQLHFTEWAAILDSGRVVQTAKC